MTGWAIPGVRIRVVDGRGPRRPARRRADRRDRRPRQHRDGRLLPRSGGDRDGDPGWLAPHRRHGHDRPGGLRPDQGPFEGHHHLRRREHLVGRDRGRDRRPSGGPRVRGDRGPGRQAGRGPGRAGRAQAGRQRHRRRSSRRSAAEHLAGFKVPREIHFRDALPKGGTGKILKAELREPFWAGLESRVH